MPSRLFLVFGSIAVIALAACGDDGTSAPPADDPDTRLFEDIPDADLPDADIVLDPGGDGVNDPVTRDLVFPDTGDTEPDEGADVEVDAGPDTDAELDRDAEADLPDRDADPDGVGLDGDVIDPDSVGIDLGIDVGIDVGIDGEDDLDGSDDTDPDAPTDADPDVPVDAPDAVDVPDVPDVPDGVDAVDAPDVPDVPDVPSDTPDRDLGPDLDVTDSDLFPDVDVVGDLPPDVIFPDADVVTPDADLDILTEPDLPPFDCPATSIVNNSTGLVFAFVDFQRDVVVLRNDSGSEFDATNVLVCSSTSPTACGRLPFGLTIPDEAEVIVHVAATGVSAWPDYYLTVPIDLGAADELYMLSPTAAGVLGYVRYGDGAPTPLWDLSLGDPPLFDLDGLWSETSSEVTVTIEEGHHAFMATGDVTLATGFESIPIWRNCFP